MAVELSSEFISGLAVLAVAQTGALVYFSGVVSTTLRQHGKQIEKIEGQCESCLPTLAILKQKDGLK